MLDDLLRRIKSSPVEAFKILQQSTSPQNVRQMGQNLRAGGQQIAQAYNTWKSAPSNQLTRSFFSGQLSNPIKQQQTVARLKQQANTTLPSFIAKPVNTARTALINRTIAPLAQVPFNLKEAVGGSPKPLLQRGLHTLQAGAGLLPGIDDVAFAGYDTLKAGMARKPLTTAFTGEEYTGLGDALTKNRNLATVGNVLELPLLLAAGKLKSKPFTIEKKLAQSIGEAKLEKMQLNAIQQGLDDKQYIRYLTDEYFKLFKKTPPKAYTKLNQPIEIDRTKLSGKQLSMTNEELVNAFKGIPSNASKLRELTQEEGMEQATTALMNQEENIPRFREIFRTFIGERQAAKTSAVVKSVPIAKLDPKKGMEAIEAIEGTVKTTDPEIIDSVNKFKTITDELFSQAKEAGIDIGYVKRYITHIWKESPAEVEKAYQSAGQKFKFASERKLPSYRAGIEAKLTPKFTTPAEILAEYTARLEKTIANIKFFNTLKKEGYVVDASVGRRFPGEFVSISAPGFPKSQTQGYYGAFSGDYYAPADIAKMINKIFSSPDDGVLEKILGVTANVTSKLQDIRMAGGIPYTPLNFWTMAQTVFKELPAGRIKGPVKAIWNGLRAKAGNQYFLDNAEVIKRMNKNDISPITLNVANFIDKGFIKNTFGDNVGQVWGKAFNDKTFKYFSPTLQIEFFKDVSKKYGDEVAAEAVKAFYGDKGLVSQALADKNWQNFLTTAFFAPKYRSTLFNFFGNLIKSISTEATNPAFNHNRRFLIGVGIYALIYDAINYKLNGNHILENEPGHQDKLKIPLKNLHPGIKKLLEKIGASQDEVIELPFFPSIFTVPRTAYQTISGTVNEGIQGAVKGGKSLLSVTARPLADIATNSDYYDRKIYDPEAEPLTQAKQVWEYANPIYGQLSHPYLEQSFSPRYKNDPTYQRLSRALEAPFKYTTEKKLNAATYYNTQDKVLRNYTKDDIEAYRLIHPERDLFDTDTDNTTTTAEKMQKAMVRANNPGVIEIEKTIALEMAEKRGRPVDPIYQVKTEQAQRYYRYQSLPPGSEDRKAMYKSFPEIGIIAEARSRYFNENPIEGSTAPLNTGELKQPFPSERASRLMDLKQWEDSEVRGYLEANRLWQNQERTKLGLAPLADYIWWEKKPKKVRTLKIKALKPKKLKLSKAKIKKLKLKPLKLAKKPKKVKNLLKEIV